MSIGNAPFRSWAARVVEEFVDHGKFGALEPEHIDRLLVWLAGREGPSSDLITAEVSARALDEAEARRLALSALDDYLFGDDPTDSLEVLGLDAQSDQETIKRRYRRLMQVYHPDRAVLHGEWITKRAETINRAYSLLTKKGPGKTRATPVYYATPVRPSYGSKTGRGVYPVAKDRFRLRKSLGSAQRFQKKVLISLVVLSSVVLGLFYISSGELGVPVKQPPARELVPENEPSSELERSKPKEIGVIGGVGTGSTPAGVGSLASVEQPRPAVKKGGSGHIDEIAKDIGKGLEETVQEADQMPASIESVLVTPPREGGDAASDGVANDVARERADESEQDAVVVHTEIGSESDSVDDRTLSVNTGHEKGGGLEASVEILKPEQALKQDPAGVDSATLTEKNEVVAESGGSGKEEDIDKKSVFVKDGPVFWIVEPPGNSMEEVVAETRVDPKELDHESGVSKLTTLPKSNEGWPKVVAIGKEWERDDMVESELLETTMHAGGKKPDSVNDGAESASVEPAQDVAEETVVETTDDSREVAHLAANPEPFAPPKRKAGYPGRVGAGKTAGKERGTDSKPVVRAVKKEVERKFSHSGDRVVSLPGIEKTGHKKNKAYFTPSEPQRESTIIERFLARIALDSYVGGIVKGDVNKLSYSIGEEIVVNGTEKSRDRMVAEYRALFKNTSERRYDYTIKSWSVIGDETIRVAGDADILFKNGTSTVESYKGKVIYYMIREGLGVKLVRIVWEY